jgi:hypothetical protein
MATINPNINLSVPLPISTGTPPDATGPTAPKDSPAKPAYAFVEGEPPKDMVMLPPGSMSSGLSSPDVSPEQWLKQSGGAQVQVSAFGLGELTSTTEVTNAQASIFAFQDMLIKLAIMLRSSEMKNRDDELQVMVTNKNAAIDKGLEAAFREMNAEILRGSSQIVSGAFSVAGGLKGEGMKDAKIGQGTISGWGGIVGGALNIAAATETYAGAKDKAEQQRAELRSEVANARMQQSIERMNGYKELMKVAVDASLAIQRDLTEAAKRTYA